MKTMEESIKTSQNAPDTTDDDLPPIRSGAITLTSEGVGSIGNFIIGISFELHHEKMGLPDF